jgi:hypothetical protein
MDERTHSKLTWASVALLPFGAVVLVITEIGVWLSPNRWRYITHNGYLYRISRRDFARYLESGAQSEGPPDLFAPWYRVKNLGVVIEPEPYTHRTVKGKLKTRANWDQEDFLDAWNAERGRRNYETSDVFGWILSWNFAIVVIGFFLILPLLNLLARWVHFALGWLMHLAGYL